MYIDSHAHFDLIVEETGITEDVLLANLKSSDLRSAVQVSIDLESLRWSLAFARRNRSSGISCTAGIHPSTPASEAQLQELGSLVREVMAAADAATLFGIGECGLDYYRMRQEKESQIRSFRYQIELAKEHHLPLIVHSRDAMDDTIAILREQGITRGIMHCFSGGREAARAVLDLGFHLSFAGNVTYRAATNLQEAAAYVPPDRLLLETDAPFLTPVPLRGKKNMPEYVINTYRFVAALRNQSVETLCEVIANNFDALSRGGPR